MTNRAVPPSAGTAPFFQTPIVKPEYLPVCIHSSPLVARYVSPSTAARAGTVADNIITPAPTSVASSVFFMLFSFTTKRLCDETKV